MADSIARYFIISVLFISVAVFTTWYFVEPEKALWITLSVLVVTCPCALSLATPAAITSAASTLANLGFLTTNNRFSETLNAVTDVVFDKTGTLTCGTFSITDHYIYPNIDITQSDAVALAASLEEHSQHPIAQAFLPKNT